MTCMYASIASYDCAWHYRFNRLSKAYVDLLRNTESNDMVVWGRPTSRIIVCLFYIPHEERCTWWSIGVGVDAQYMAGLSWYGCIFPKLYSYSETLYANLKDTNYPENLSHKLYVSCSSSCDGLQRGRLVRECLRCLVVVGSSHLSYFCKWIICQGVKPPNVQSFFPRIDSFRLTLLYLEPRL